MYLPVGSQWLVDQLASFVRLCPPGGIDLFLTALIVESYYSLVLLVEPFDLSQPLSNWERTVNQNVFDTYIGYIRLIRDCLDLSFSLQFLKPSRDYMNNLLAYYQDIRNDDLRFWIKLKEGAPTTTNREISPASEDFLILSSMSDFYRNQISVNVEFEQFDRVYICDLKGNFNPIEVSTSPSNILVTPNQIGDHTIVVADEVVTNLSDLDRVSSHSVVKEVTAIDKQTPYVP